MPRHPILTVLFLIYVFWGAWNWFVNRPVHPPDGVLAADDPWQGDLWAGDKVPIGGNVQIGRWALTVRAGYRVTARILSVERYHFDSMSDLVPEDLALGWGPMSDNRTLRTIDISQSNRFFYWRGSAKTPIARDSIIAHSANTHVIPADVLVARQLSRLRPGQVVSMVGELVDARRSDGVTLHTSMVRTDTGPGACEVFLVTDVASPPP